MRNISKTVPILMALLLSTATFASCGGTQKSNGTEITFYVGIDNFSVETYTNLVDSYNKGQGVIDGVSVKMVKKSAGYDADLSTTLAGNPPDVMNISDKYFKQYAINDGLFNIQSLLDDASLITYDKDGKKYFDVSEISTDVVNRLRIDLSTKQAGYPANPLYGMPNGSNNTFLYYNIDALSAQNINIISKDESELAGTDYSPSGYAEYVIAPESGLQASANLEGETVYKVFNNKIPMNWEEIVRISKYLTKSYNSTSTTTYGFLSDWWFSYGWSVGGDCMNWSEEKNQYVFTLGDANTNYLVVDDVIVNGTSYKAGEILEYKDKTYVADNEEEFESVIGTSLYALPSQYDAFAEYCALSQTTDQKVDTEKYGYAISPTYEKLSTYPSKSQFFTSKEVAILAEGYNIMNNLAKNTVGSNLIHWDVAPLWQYKVYEGGEEGQFKVVGKDYDGKVFEGKIKEVNGTKIVGKESGSSVNSVMIIAKKAKNPQAAFKFLQWACGYEGQKIVGDGNFSTPNQVNYNLSDEYLNSSKRLCKNMEIISKASEYETIGDWSYVENGQWVSHWSNILNGPVRNGKMTLAEFFYGKSNKVEETANENLSQYKIRIYGK